jgi:hydrogenase maturation protease
MQGMQVMGEKTLVLGIGNTLLSDEGVGVHIVRSLEASARPCHGPEIEFLDAGTLSFSLAPRLEEVAALIVIDAAQLGAAPGTIRVIEGEAMDAFLSRHRKLSVHEVSLLDLLQILRLTGTLPAQRALVGVQPQLVDWSDMPTEPVARAIPVACGMVMDLIDRWHS